MNNQEISLLRQITIHELDYHLIKSCCIRTNQTLTSFYRDMLDWFFGEHINDTHLVMQASVKQGKRLSLWIDNKQITLIKSLAMRFRASDARVIYTALVHYLEHIK